MVDVQELMKGARTSVKQCMNVRSGESVLVLTDTKMPKEISEALVKALEEIGAKVSLEIMQPLEKDGQEPSEKITELMKIPDVLFLVTSKSLSHTKARREASKKGVRIASMPNVSEFSFRDGGLTADYHKVKELCDLMFKKISKTHELRVTSGNGTNLAMKVGKYSWERDNGFYSESGQWGNLPAGEVATSPIEGTTNGILVIDKMGTYGENIEVTIKDGLAVKIKGSEKLKQDVEEVGEGARNIAEIGIGTNPKARIIGNVLEDEKVFGTVHIALGNNTFCGGTVDVPFHVDGIILKPTLEADGKILIKDGKWVLEEQKVSDYSEQEDESISHLDEEKSEIKEKVLQKSQKIYQSVGLKQNPYGPYIPIKELPDRYFPRFVLGFARPSTGEGFVRSTLYGTYKSIVKLHEKLHLLHPSYSESMIRGLTSYLSNYGYAM